MPGTATLAPRLGSQHLLVASVSEAFFLLLVPALGPPLRLATPPLLGAPLRWAVLAAMGGSALLRATMAERVFLVDTVASLAFVAFVLAIVLRALCRNSDPWVRRRVAEFGYLLDVLLTSLYHLWTRAPGSVDTVN